MRSHLTRSVLTPTLAVRIREAREKLIAETEKKMLAPPKRSWEEKMRSFAAAYGVPLSYLQLDYAALDATVTKALRERIQLDYANVCLAHATTHASPAVLDGLTGFSPRQHQRRPGPKVPWTLVRVAAVLHPAPGEP